MPLEIRRVRPDEHEAAGALTLAAYETHLGATEDDYRRQLADVSTRDANSEVWVAVEDGRLLGNVTLCPPGSPYREIAAEDEGEFRMLAVDPAAQGRGVGTALVRLALDRARADGVRGMVLSTLATMGDAHRIYERLGLTRAPERDWSPVPGVDLLVYSLVFDTATLRFTVGEGDTAIAVGSGSLPVLGTPRLLAWCEAATCRALAPELARGSTSVGTRVTLEHAAPSPVGAEVEVTASIIHRDGRLVRFSVAARHAEDRKVVGTGEVTRVVVDAERFLARIQA